MNLEQQALLALLRQSLWGESGGFHEKLNWETLDTMAALPEELQFTARLRLNNPDITLSELAELHFPPVSKSGVYHRLEKVMAFYEKNLKNSP